MKLLLYSAEDAHTKKERDYLDGVHIADDGEGFASAMGAATNVVGKATADGIKGVSGLAINTVFDLSDGSIALLL